MILKDISKLPPSAYKVTDFALEKGRVKNWYDKIVITYHASSIFHITCSRKSAYKYGLCVKADE